MLITATTLDQAIVANGEYQAGGTDVQARRRAGISSGPIVDISRLDGYRQIEQQQNGTTTVGALVTVAQLENDGTIRNGYAGLAMAAHGLATPQIRAAATVGGALLQRTRCWYYRHPAYGCFKSGGDVCYAREGPNPNGVVFDLGPCVFPHPSTLGMALLAYEAHVEINDAQTLSIAQLYGDGSDPHHDHVLNNSQLLTRIILPPPLDNERSAYFRSISRAEAEWPIVECFVRLQIEEERISFARVAVGGVANIPLRLPHVEQHLIGQVANADTVAAAAQLATEGANPLPQTQIKLTFLSGTVQETLERALSA